MPALLRISRWLFFGLLLLPAVAGAAVKHHCPTGSEWVAGHRNPAGHWIKGHCLVTKPVSTPHKEYVPPKP